MMGYTSRLYTLVVREREDECRQERWNNISFRKVTQSISERWKKCGKLKSEENEGEKKKIRKFSLDFYFSDRDSAYCSQCPSDWNPLEISGDFCESDIDDTYSSVHWSLSPLKNPVKIISKSVKGRFNKCRKSKKKSTSTICPITQTPSCSSFHDSGLSDSFDELQDDIEVTSICTSNPLSTSPPPILKPGTSSSPTSLPEKSKRQKTVSLLIPHKRNANNLFGIHLQLETVQIVQVPEGHLADVSGQQRQVLCKARHQMEETFPSLAYTVHILFSDNMRILLETISSTMIGDLMFKMRTILFSPLLIKIPSIDIILGVLLRFLHQVSVILQSEANCEYFPQWWLHLWDNWRKTCYNEQDREECVAQIRAVYVDMWCVLVVAD